VTGVGVVSPVGIGKAAFWDSLTHGRSGISRITHFDTSKLPVHHAGEVKDFNPTDYMDEMRAQMTGRCVHFALAASKIALQDAGVEPDKFPKNRLAIIGGTTAPSCDSLENHFRTALEKDPFDAPPYALASLVVHAATAEVSQTLNLFESATTITTVCTSGTNAIGAALKEIRAGRRDMVLAGSTESTIAYYTFVSYILAGMLVNDDDEPPEKIMRPFDKNRRGGVMSEGAAFVMLEELEHARARGAHIYGEVIGYGFRDKFIGPKSAKQTMANSMRIALTDARIKPGAVDYILANGTSIVVQDKMETMAMKEVFGDCAYRFPISAIKSMIGIPNSAIGPMQLVSACLSFETDVIPPTINYETPDPECDLDYVPNTARYNRVNIALINNYGMDGGCASLIARRYSNGRD
jgi:3-oxoacyl-[acyl-carrier-protein] synthase II